MNIKFNNLIIPIIIPRIPVRKIIVNLHFPIQRDSYNLKQIILSRQKKIIL